MRQFSVGTLSLGLQGGGDQAKRMGSIDGIMPVGRSEVLTTEHDEDWGFDALVFEGLRDSNGCQLHQERFCRPALSPGCMLLRNVQVQLADDSLHAVRITLREKTLQIVEGLDRAKLLRWRDVYDHRFMFA